MIGPVKRSFCFYGIAAILFSPLCAATALADFEPTRTPTPLNQAEASEGARIFVERCVLCHGNYGAGDGFMPLIVKGYPQTNLLQAETSGHFSDLERTVRWGGAKGAMNDKSPPWVGELNPAEMEAVAQFVVQLQEHPENTSHLLDKYLSREPVDIETGRLVYQTRCASCHGLSGHGDGRMSAIIKTPPPTDLTASRLPESFLQEIIVLGGKNVGRSAQMPAWKYELSQVQIDSVVEYIQLLRSE